MAISKSTEFGGIDFSYDASKNPFFEALVNENLRKIRALPTGKAILQEIEIAKPAYVPKEWPAGINVLFQPPLEKVMIAPGLKRARTADDENPYTLVLRDKDLFFDWDLRGRGALVPGLDAKTAAKEVKTQLAQVGANGKPGGGCGCWCDFSNIEIRSKSGEWLPTEITMGHELIHCVHHLNGITRKNFKEEEWATVGIKGFDKQALTENKLRNEAGYKVRTKYFADD